MTKKLIKESTLRKQLLNMVLDFTQNELLDMVFDVGNGEFQICDVDWDILRGRSMLTKFLPDEE